jgi:hypothetical protein
MKTKAISTVNPDVNEPNGTGIAAFLLTVPTEYRDFVMQTHEVLTKIGCKVRFQHRKSGYTAQYNYPVTKRLAFQFSASDATLGMYLYAGFIFRFDNLLDSLPASIAEELKSFRNCTDMEADCYKNTTIKGKVYRKCMNGRKLFPVNDETMGILFVLQEISKIV